MISKKILVYVLILFVSVVFMRCASVSKAPAEKSESAKTFEAPSDRGSVFLYRTGRVVGAAGQLQVRVNGQNAGGTGPGTFFRWDLKPGTYTFLSATGESSAVIELNVKAGEMYFVRQDARIGLDSGRVSMKEVSGNKGKSEVKSLKLLVSAYTPE